MPERRLIGIFNRSYYEEVLVVRVHSDLLKNEQMPPSLISKKIWEHRFQDICAFERYLSRNGIIVRKFFLNLSKEEQKKRFLARLEEQEKNWKFSLSDMKERKYWNQYRDAYEEMIQNTATPQAPWYVVPADNKWFTRLVVAAAIIDTLAELHVDYPKVGPARRKELVQIHKRLKAE
jgi:polyphosphate kinase 2 (PPK2 family)